MNHRSHILNSLRKLHPDFKYGEQDLWDLLPASRGLTVIMLDGAVFPLPIAEGASRQLLHSWSVEARAR